MTSTQAVARRRRRRDRTRRAGCRPGGRVAAREVVDDDHVVAPIAKEPDDMRTDVPGAAGDED